MYAIQRIHLTPNSKGWCVTSRRRQRKFTKNFFEVVFGGSRKALAAAIAWRDRSIAKAEAISLRDFCALKRSSNTSGVPGVHYLRTVRQPSGIWQAWVKLPDGGKVHRSFSVLRFGETEAFRLAVAARAELLQLVAERPYLRHPIAKRLEGATFASSGARLRFKICAAATEDSPALSASLS